MLNQGQLVRSSDKGTPGQPEHEGRDSSDSLTLNLSFLLFPQCCFRPNRERRAHSCANQETGPGHIVGPPISPLNPAALRVQSIANSR